MSKKLHTKKTTSIPMSPEAEQQERLRKRAVSALRAVFIILLAVITALTIVEQSETSGRVEFGTYWWVILLSSFSFFAAVVGIDILTERRKLATITAILLGIFTGVIATAIISIVIDLFVKLYLELPEDTEEFKELSRFVLMFKLIIGLGLSYLGITTILKTQDDFRLVIPYVEFAKRFRGPRPLLLDTSTLIDGRVIGLAESGLIQTPIVLPQFVLEELQQLADSSDKLKRSRGRRGLDLARTLQHKAEVSIEPGSAGTSGVDTALLAMAESLPASIITTDTGLLSLAHIRGVPAINLNTVAQAMKPPAVPGTTLSLEIVRQGDQQGQGIGFLEDGTMVVVDKAADLIGEELELVIKTTMQTAAGRLVFARLKGDTEEQAQTGQAFTAQENEQEPTTAPEPAVPPSAAQSHSAKPQTAKPDTKNPDAAQQTDLSAAATTQPKQPADQRLGSEPPQHNTKQRQRNPRR